jgi:hypothetical protein
LGAHVASGGFRLSRWLGAGGALEKPGGLLRADQLGVIGDPSGSVDGGMDGNKH